MSDLSLSEGYLLPKHVHEAKVGKKEDGSGVVKSGYIGEAT